jgi:hypothetical protein
MINAIMRSWRRMSAVVRRTEWPARVGLGVLVLTSFAFSSDAATASDPTPQGRDWTSIAKLPDWQGIWELDWQHNPRLMDSEPPSLLPAAQAKLTAYKQGQQKGENLQTDAANCLPPGMPQIMTQPYPIEFLFNPGKVVVVIEAYSQVRHIYTDGRPHPTDPDPAFLGHSIGHWEGSTLIVDTVGFVPDSQIAPGIGHSDAMHILERIHKVDPEHLQIETTITDPKVLAKPWKTVHPYVRVHDDLREYVCEQNNHDSADPQGRPGQRLNQ